MINLYNFLQMKPIFDDKRQVIVNHTRGMAQFFSCNTKQRLGFIAEECFGAYLENIGARILARNVQINQGQKTIGEIDFLYQIKEIAYHCEIAVKFYLLTGAGKSLDDFLGPNVRDNLGKKWRRLNEHQLQLTQHPTFRSIAIENNWPSSFVPQLHVVGRLFYPFDDFIEQKFPKFTGLNPNHEKGFWIHFKEIEKLSAFTSFYVLSKIEWLVGRQSKSLMNFTELNSSLQYLDRVIQIECVLANSMVTKGFIVPNNYPQ